METNVLVVGAGPAGVASSITLSQRGIDHVLIDRAVFPRDKVDGNAFGQDLLAALNRLNRPDLAAALLASPDLLPCPAGAWIFSDRGDRYQPPLPHPADQAPIYTMDRQAMDALLLGFVDRSTADLRLGCELVTLEPAGDRLAAVVKIGEQTETLHTKLVIGADGARSRVASLLLNQTEDPTDRALTLHRYYRNVASFEQPHIEAHYIQPLLPGFVFIAPLAHGRFKVGLGTRADRIGNDPARLSGLLSEVIAAKPWLRERLATAEPISEPETWPMTFGGSAQIRRSGDRVLLAGDAAGLCNPLTGFGTAKAIDSGRLAAAVAATAIRVGQFDRAALSAYDRDLQRLFDQEFVLSRRINRWNQSPWLMNFLTGRSLPRRLLQSAKTLRRWDALVQV
ncbi:NAD(P)/FAD-dependent oxidoreductase [Limnothrix sp. FACHB-1083]|uniref:NAD(P)/FAD-dependent oxidoreductase n=1 Tax=unclassified Limnothrix TaxID=2632864 RepID=UPI00167FF82E|nr:MULTISPECIES: NAD(P)/FAD-dependent oxidoreductase [unclassified Limnothrix]MBD2159902.1 NAD(P)/FAD-dependent oxidoreductase [Limnothrix sp. FACHB-1083]MBD2190603.1 NAD(P)/FAD-dependent oxidoreductase [Limnothrix sp. FACHB-1088]